MKCIFHCWNIEINEVLTERISKNTKIFEMVILNRQKNIEAIAVENILKNCNNCFKMKFVFLRKLSGSV